MGQVLYYDEKAAMKRVLYTGSDLLKEGYALCYDRDNITATAKAAGLNGAPIESTELNVDAALTAAYASYGRHSFVEKPAAGNLDDFAGVVGPSSDGVTGPAWIDLIEPTAIGRSTRLWTDESCTIDSTLLGVQPGSYAFGVDGKIVAKAAQTIDRSSTNGLVQAIMLSTATLSGGMSALSRAATALPTAAIWDNFPLDAMRANPMLGSLFETDFRDGVSFPANKFGDTTGLVYPGLPAIGELTFFSSADNEAIEAQWGVPIDLVGGGKWAFEGRVKATVTTTEYGGWFFGLAAAQVLVGDIIADNGAAMTDSDYLGFLHLFPKTNEVDIEYKAVGQTLQVHDATVKTMTTLTYFTVGMYHDGTDIQTYVDGVNLADPILGTGDMDAATFPSTKILVPTITVKGGNAADFVATFDWMRFAQL